MVTLTAQKAIPFTEDFKFPLSHEVITFDAASFQCWVDACLPQASELRSYLISETPDLAEMLAIGDYYLLRRKLPPTYMRQPTSGGFFPTPTGKPYEAQSRLKMFQGSKLAYAAFSDAVSIPILAEKQKLKEVWMSLTPMEIATCRGGVRKAFGHVLVGGLGLGWMTQRILERKQVEHVTVVETDQAVIDTFGIPLQKAHPDRLTLVKNDVWKYLRAERSTDALGYLKITYDYPGAFDSYIMDVWQAYGRAEYDPYFVALKQWAQAHKKRIWGWGDVKNMPNSR